MLENITVREFVGGFTRNELLELYKTSLKWENPTLLVVSQQELIRRGEKEVVITHLTNYLSNNKIKSDCVFARMLAASLTGERDLFLESLKNCIESASPEGKTVRLKDVKDRMEAQLKEGELFYTSLLDEEDNYDDCDSEEDSTEEEPQEEKEERFYQVGMKTNLENRISFMGSRVRITLYS